MAGKVDKRTQIFFGGTIKDRQELEEAAIREGFTYSSGKAAIGLFMRRIVLRYCRGELIDRPINNKE